jgi:DNA-binding NarL/FixJ family response regulator
MMPAQSVARDADVSYSPTAPRVLLVEDERAVGDALTDCLEQIGCTVIAAPDLNSANASARDDAQVFDVAILDLELPDGNGLELVEALRSRANPCVSLVLTGHEEVEWARRAAAMAIERSREMRAWLAKDEDKPSTGDAEVVAEAVVADLQHPTVRPVRTPQEQVHVLSREFGLTDRQTEALERVSQGCRDREIADAMGVSYSRVRQLLAAGFGKLGVKSRNDFIRFLCERQG